jgi:ABC-2 type transport system ATP-binding protein
VIDALELTKSYGGDLAVDGLSFTAAPGRVTGFLGLNGSGKTTTLRMLLGLTRPDAGEALINGRAFRRLSRPLRQVGAVLDQGVCHPGQSGRAHLMTQAMLSGTGRRRADALLEYVGLDRVANRRTGDYSLGMRQRLAVAVALLADPPVLILDEPANGLDPGGIAWLRGLLRDRARAGGTVLISSHLLAELAQLIDDVVIIADGRLMAQSPLEELAGGHRLRVRGRDPRRLWHVLRDAGARVTADGYVLEVEGLTAEDVGELAHRAGVPIYELRDDAPSLEQVFMSLAAPR